MLRVDFNSLEYQIRRFRSLSERLGDIEDSIRSGTVRLSEMSGEDELLDPMQEKLEEQLRRTVRIRERCLENISKLERILELYHENENELLRLTDSLPCDLIKGTRTAALSLPSNLKIVSTDNTYPPVISNVFVNDLWLVKLALLDCK